LFCKRTSTWQHLSLRTFPSRFTFNSITAAILCSVFAYIGIYFERKTKEELVEAKSRAEKQEQQVSEQNARLKDIAYLNAHIVRAPLANILALTSLIDETKVPDEETKELIHYLQESAEILDNNIKEIISKATYINS
jgi:signal transduction histidine kinase